jgi:hypothetical protein
MTRTPRPLRARTDTGPAPHAGAAPSHMSGVTPDSAAAFPSQMGQVMSKPIPRSEPTQDSRASSA